MKVFFDSCHEAIDNAIKTRTFGLYYSETAKPNLDIHVHDCCEVFLSLSSGNTFLINDKVYDINENELFILNQFDAHKVTALKSGKFARFSLHVHPEFIHANSTIDSDLYKCFYEDGKLDKITLSSIQANNLKNLFFNLSKNYEYGDDLYKKIHAVEILLEVIKIYNANQVKNDCMKGNSTILLAIDFINKNYMRQITLEEIAKNSFVSVNKLCYLFKTHLYTTVNKYLTSTRITQAKMLLHQGKSVTETAYSCGFNDYAHFIRTFKSLVGISPGKYKNDSE